MGADDKDGKDGGKKKVPKVPKVSRDKTVAAATKRKETTSKNAHDGQENENKRSKVVVVETPEAKVPEAKVPEAKDPEAKVPEAKVPEVVQQPVVVVDDDERGVEGVEQEGKENDRRDDECRPVEDVERVVKTDAKNDEGGSNGLSSDFVNRMYATYVSNKR